MKVLFVSGELIAGDLAYRLKQEGCDVKLFIEDASRKDCFENMVKKTSDWRKKLKWVGKDGLIVFDDVLYGDVQDDLRKQGYNVVGGSTGGDKLEKDRAYAQTVLEKSGLKNILPTFNFKTIDAAIKYIQKNPGAWVAKQNGHLGMFNYVGEKKDGSDVVGILESYKIRGLDKHFSISLQKKIIGVEVGVARYFNGQDWVGPIEYGVEHKKFLNDDIGPLTAEMGTVMWYDENENTRLYRETLPKIKSFLQKINFKGDVAINFIVDKNHCYPLELTTRFGSPAIHLQMEIHQSLWKDFLMAVAKGNKFKLKYKKGFGVVVCMAVPPFPYIGIGKTAEKYYPKGAPILFKEKISKEEIGRIHFEEVGNKKSKNTDNFYIAGANGYILYVDGFGKTVEEASAQAYKLVNKIIIPKSVYRTDIGKKFAAEGLPKLKKWGWI